MLNPIETLPSSMYTPPPSAAPPWPPSPPSPPSAASPPLAPVRDLHPLIRFRRALRIHPPGLAWVAQRISHRGIGFALRATFTTIATERPVVGDGAILHDEQTIGDINAASFAFTSFASIAAASDFGEIIAAVGSRVPDLPLVPKLGTLESIIPLPPSPPAPPCAKFASITDPSLMVNEPPAK